MARYLRFTVNLGTVFPKNVLEAFGPQKSGHRYRYVVIDTGIIVTVCMCHHHHHPSPAAAAAAAAATTTLVVPAIY